MLCPNCKKVIDDTSSFCPFCNENFSKRKAAKGLFSFLDSNKSSRLYATILALYPLLTFLFCFHFDKLQFELQSFNSIYVELMGALWVIQIVLILIDRREALKDTIELPISWFMTVVLPSVYTIFYLRKRAKYTDKMKSAWAIYSFLFILSVTYSCGIVFLGDIKNSFASEIITNKLSTIPYLNSFNANIRGNTLTNKVFNSNTTNNNYKDINFQEILQKKNPNITITKEQDKLLNKGLRYSKLQNSQAYQDSVISLSKADLYKYAKNILVASAKYPLNDTNLPDDLSDNLCQIGRFSDAHPTLCNAL